MYLIYLCIEIFIEIYIYCARRDCPHQRESFQKCFPLSLLTKGVVQFSVQLSIRGFHDFNIHLKMPIFLDDRNYIRYVCKEKVDMPILWSGSFFGRLKISWSESYREWRKVRVGGWVGWSLPSSPLSASFCSGYLACFVPNRWSLVTN